MPMHDWKRVPATIYHLFHQRWTISICDALNGGLLPPGYSALVEQYSSGLYPDVLTYPGLPITCRQVVPEPLERVLSGLP